MSLPKKKWWKEDVVYQIYPRSFKDSKGDGLGDIQGIISKVPYLKELGVDVIWLSPHFDSPNADNGYDIRDYEKVMEEFGTMEDFDTLLKDLNNSGIKLIIDLVVNHSSDEHRWFQESKKSLDNPYRDYYIWRSGKEGKAPSNWPSFFGGSAWEYDKTTDQYYLHYFAKKQPDLNWENEDLRKEVYQIMKFWLDKGVSGFRMDVIPLISKHQDFKDMSVAELPHPETIYASGPRLHEFLQEMHAEVLSKYDVMTVGEAFGVTETIMNNMTDERRDELDLAFIFDIVRIGRDNWVQNEWSLPELKSLFQEQNNTDQFHWPTVFVNNHDNPRSVSKFGCDDPKYRDMSAKLLAILTLTQKGTPFLYQGEELGMTNYNFTSFDEFDDVEIRGNYDQVLESGVTKEAYLQELNKSSRDHSRTPMQWSNTKQAGFTEADKSWLVVNPNYTEINVDQQSKEQSVLNFYKKLLQFRKGKDDLIYGDYKDLDPEHAKVFAYTRTGVKETYAIILNMSSDALEFSFDLHEHHFTLALTIGEEPLGTVAHKNVKLQPWDGHVYVSKNKL